MPSKLNSTNVLAGKDKKRGYKGACARRTTITVIECVNGNGRYLNTTITWPASTHRAEWSMHHTPRWHYVCSESRFTASYISLQWLKIVFNTQTKEHAYQKPWVLICEGSRRHWT